MPNRLTKMAMELLAIESDFVIRPQVDPKTNRRPSVDAFDLHVFEQVWSSTALGFGGVGGQAMTAANTYVLVPMIPDQQCHVYFAGRYAYSADYTKAFEDDLRNQRMVARNLSGKYREKKDE